MSIVFFFIFRFHVTLLEKDAASRLQQSNPELQFADIALDERACVLVVAMEVIVKGNPVNEIMKRVKGLRDKFERCFVLLHSAEADKR